MNVELFDKGLFSLLNRFFNLLSNPLVKSEYVHVDETRKTERRDSRVFPDPNFPEQRGP